MDKLKSKAWWKAAATRALKTFAQTFIASIPTSAGIMSDVNWMFVCSASGLAAILSLMTSLAGLPEVTE